MISNDAYFIGLMILAAGFTIGFMFRPATYKRCKDCGNLFSEDELYIPRFGHSGDEVCLSCLRRHHLGLDFWGNSR